MTTAELINLRQDVLDAYQKVVEASRVVADEGVSVEDATLTEQWLQVGEGFNVLCGRLYKMSAMLGTRAEQSLTRR